MSWWWRCLRTAVRHVVLEQARNRLALVLVVFFVPLWLWLAYRVLPDTPVRFFLRAAGHPVSMGANTVTQLSGALHSIALIVGFMMFLATSRSAEFDRRLVTAGFPKVCLLLAKNTVLLLSAVLTGCYATVWLCVFWQPERLDVMAAAFAGGALTYGGAGILLAAVLRSELAGMFLVIMVSFVDLSLQNPVANPAADSPLLRGLPAYGAMQSAVSASTGALTPWHQLLLSGCWAVALATAGPLVLTFRGGRWTGILALLRRPGGATGTGRNAAWCLRHPVLSLIYRRAGITDPALVAGYEACRRLVRSSGPMEIAFTQLIPARVRPLFWAMYGYARVIDDLSDTLGDSHQDRAARVSAFSLALEADLRQGHSSDPVRGALVHAVWAWDLASEGLASANAVFRMDAARQTEFANWDEWHTYWDTLAFPFDVSRLTALLSGPGLFLAPRDAEALRRWNHAFNLIDCLGDLHEDAENGCIKLPATVLGQYGVTAEDVRLKQPGAQFATMVHALAGQAREWLGQGASIGEQHPPVAAAFRTVVELQHLELRRIERNPQALLDGRRPPNPVRFQYTLLRGRLSVAWAWHRHRPTGSVTTAALPAPRQATDDHGPDTAQALLPPAPHPGGAVPPTLSGQQIPQHVAIIMDGNGRWAEAQGEVRSAGHHAGQHALRDVIYGALEIGLPCLSVYAFSTENWARPAAEIETVLHVVSNALDMDTEELWRRDVQLRWSGSANDGRLPADLVDRIHRTIRATRERTGLILNVCLNYGGRHELTHAARALARQAAHGGLDPDRITPRHLARHLYQPDLPDVDLLIRTSGEQRTSNFLPWQSTYAEYLFLDPLWPDIDRTHLWAAISTYATRDRRFGTTR
ncbi:polyprenyl diphosphate synthase [Streptomyces violascens]|uniref:polyprenyl diphosphate synthase n=1 Tax=Streptomyces violascens TaxID=67381 RepID=UPI00365F689A